jgi:hypothetical protein
MISGIEPEIILYYYCTALPSSMKERHKQVAYGGLTFHDLVFAVKSTTPVEEQEQEDKDKEQYFGIVSKNIT